MRTLKQKTALVFSFTLSSLILGYIFFSLDWSAFLSEFNKIQIIYLIPLILLWIMTNLCRALRWQILLGGSKVVGITQSFEAMMVGFFATFVLPLRAGEFIRAIFIARISPLSFSKSFATIIVERVFDVLTLLLFLAFCIGRLDEAPALVDVGSKTLGLICCAIVLFMISSYRYPRYLKRFVYLVISKLNRKKFSATTKKLLHIFDEFLGGLCCLDSWKTLLTVGLCSIGVWVLSIWFYQVAVIAMNINADFWLGAIITLMVALAVASPSAPGFVGTFQAGCVVALSVIYSYSKEFSVAYSIFVHVIQALLIIGTGGWYLVRRGIKLSQLNS